MNVKDLIENLSMLPQDAEVLYAWDGEARSEVACVWLSRNGGVIISDGDVIYSTESRPIDAPDNEQDPYWEPDI